MNTQSIKIPVWYWILAVLFLLWNLMGLNQFFTINFMSDEALAELPQAEQDLYNSYPAWINIVFAMAVFGGTIGAIGLLMRKKWARMAFIISLIGIVPQMIHNLFFTKAMDVYGPGSAFMPVMVVALGFFLVWYAGFCSKKGWLR